MPDEDKLLNPKEFCYCGYTCPGDCEFYVATRENDVVKKKAAFEKWDMNNKSGLKFDPETAFCYTCKSEENPVGLPIQYCNVCKCAIEKGIDCCIECHELKNCE